MPGTRARMRRLTGMGVSDGVAIGRAVVVAKREVEVFRIPIPEEDLEPLPEGSYYHHELRGLRVEDEAGTGIGTVADILKTGAGADVLVVKGPFGETLLPLASHFVKRVDLGAGLLVAAIPELVDVAH